MSEDFQKQISSLNIADLDISELEDVTISLTKNFVLFSKEEVEGKKIFDEKSLICIKHLKLICTKGSSFQNLIAHTHGMLNALKEYLSYEEDASTKLQCFQLLANLCVQNQKVQRLIWDSCGALIMENLNSNESKFVNIAAMIIYNIYFNKSSEIEMKKVIENCLHHYDSFLQNSTNPLPEFVHILLDHFICGTDEIGEAYEHLNSHEKKLFLFYIHDHIENESNKIIHESLIKALTLEFKQKSDCVLKTVTTYVDSIDPEIVVILLDIISIMSTQEKFLGYLKSDRSLFLNIGCLLQALHKVGKESSNTFTPIQKLDALVPTSEANADFEKEISFTFKSKLVKSIANLSFRNKKNQELAREMEIMQSIFECTNADARNPLIREWSILAIRNLCEENLENQEIVQQLTRIGNVENPVLSEFGIDSGILRINK